VHQITNRREEPPKEDRNRSSRDEKAYRYWLVSSFILHT